MSYIATSADRAMLETVRELNRHFTPQQTNAIIRRYLWLDDAAFVTALVTVRQDAHNGATWDMLMDAPIEGAKHV